MSTEPAHREEVEAGIFAAYDAAGLGTPRMVWVPDPAVGVTVAATLWLTKRMRVVEDKVSGQYRSRAKKLVRKLYSPHLYWQVRQEFQFSEIDRLERAVALATHVVVTSSSVSLGWMLENEGWARRDLWQCGRFDDYLRRTQQLAMSITATPPGLFHDLPGRDRLRSRANRFLRCAVGQRDHLRDLAALEAVARISGIDIDGLDSLSRIAKNASWWWPLDQVAVVCDRTSAALFDQHGRMHCETGPALAYRNGFSVYSWHGRPVPPWVVMNPTVKGIRSEKNIEVRRCAIESMGWDRFADEAKLRLIDQSPDPGNPGQRLSLYTLPRKVWGTSASLLVCTNGSVSPDGVRRIFGVLVPPVESAMRAAAWSYGLSPAEYARMQRRA